MEIDSIAMIAAGWIVLSMLVSLVLGRVFSHAAADITEKDLANAEEHHNVVRPLRNRKAARLREGERQAVTAKNLRRRAHPG
jgi:hypothetical protein